MFENVFKILKITKKNFAHFFNKGGGSTTLIIGRSRTFLTQGGAGGGSTTRFLGLNHVFI